jgi:hypothetical protein
MTTLDAERLSVPDAIANGVVAHVASWGRKGVETGGFLLARREAPKTVFAAALAGERGAVAPKRRVRPSVTTAKSTRGFSTDDASTERPIPSCPAIEPSDISRAIVRHGSIA